MMVLFFIRTENNPKVFCSRSCLGFVGSERALRQLCRINVGHCSVLSTNTFTTQKQTSERLPFVFSLNAENFPSYRLFPILRIRAGRLCEECQKNRGSRAEDQNCSKASNSHPRILIHGKHRIAKQQIKPLLQNKNYAVPLLLNKILTLCLFLPTNSTTGIPKIGGFDNKQCLLNTTVDTAILCLDYV